MQETAHHGSPECARQSKSKKLWIFPIIIIVLGLSAGLALTMKFPPVVGLGTLVRLPVFHGALTWANFILFAAMAVTGLVTFFARRARLYPWLRAMRYSAVALWIFNFMLGLFASSLTWNFEASSKPAILYFLQEPRVQMQLFVSLMGIIILILPLIFEKWRTLALFDGLYGVLTLVLAGLAMQAPNSLHPPSPVMNADEFIIRFTFITIGFSLMMMSAGIVLLVRNLLKRA